MFLACDNNPCVGLPSNGCYLDIVLLLMQFGSSEKFDECAINAWNNGNPSKEITEIIQNERKVINERGLKKIIKVPTFSLWPEKERIGKLKGNCWPEENINESLEQEKINGNIAGKYFNPKEKERKQEEINKCKPLKNTKKTKKKH